MGSSNSFFATGQIREFFEGQRLSESEAVVDPRNEGDVAPSAVVAERVEHLLHWRVVLDEVGQDVDAAAVELGRDLTATDELEVVAIGDRSGARHPDRCVVVGEGDCAESAPVGEDRGRCLLAQFFWAISAIGAGGVEVEVDHVRRLPPGWCSPRVIGGDVRQWATSWTTTSHRCSSLRRTPST